MRCVLIGSRCLPLILIEIGLDLLRCLVHGASARLAGALYHQTWRGSTANCDLLGDFWTGFGQIREVSLGLIFVSNCILQQVFM